MRAHFSPELALKLTLTLGLIIIDMIWILLAGYSFDLFSLMGCLLFTSLMGAIGFIYGRLRPDARLSTMGTETAFLISFSAAGCIFSYLVTATNMPLIDQQLVQLDQRMGFDWHSYIAFVNGQAWLGKLSSLVYQSTLYQIAFAMLILPLMGQIERCRELTLNVMFSSLGCVLVSGLLPSAGALGHFQPDAAFYMQNAPVVDLAYKQAFFDLRQGLTTHLSLRDVHGLIAFPSYHVGLSVIVVFAFRGVTGWFWPILCLNLLVILSTPIDGGHHLSDAVGGFILALATSALVVLIRARLQKAPLLTPLAVQPGLSPDPALVKHGI